MNELLIIPVCRGVLSEQGQLILMRRFLEGVGAYAERWSGSVTVFIRQAGWQVDGLDPVIFNPDEHDFNVELLPVEMNRLKERLSSAAVVLGTLANDNLEIGRLCQSAGTPLVWITETSVKTRAQIIDAQVHNLVRRLKRKAGNHLQEFHFRSAITKASGVQCNGAPTYQAYKDINLNALLFFDSRVHQKMLLSEREIQTKAKHIAKGLPLRLAFSGRLTEIKGVEHLLRVAYQLKKLNIPYILNIFGDGNLKSRLASDIVRLELSSQVHLRGVLDFHTELLPTIQQSVDLFLCCHLQGDPSCTYLETMACGIPIVGYANEAWQGMHDVTEAGWLVEMGNVKQMAETIANIHNNRSAWMSVALAARSFAAEHTFEETMTTRIAHLKQCAKLN